MGQLAEQPQPIARQLSRPQAALLGVAGIMALCAPVIGRTFQLAVLFLCIAATVVLAIPLIAESSGPRRRPYYALFASGSCLLGAVLAAEYIPALAFGTHPYLIGAVLNMGWALLAAYSNQQLGKRKASTTDATASIDAILVGLGAASIIWVLFVAPAMQADEMSSLPKSFFIAMVIAEILLFGAIMRIAMTPAKIAPGASLFVIGGLIIFVGNVVATRGMVSFGHSFSSASVAMISLGVLIVGAAAAKSTAQYWDTPAVPSSITVGYARLVGTSLAVITPLLLVMVNRNDALVTWGVGLLGICTAALVAVRFAGLMKSHVIALEQESIISRNAIALASSVERRSMYEAALDSVVLLCGGRRVKAAVFLLKGNDWRFVAQSPAPSTLRDFGLENVADELNDLREASRKRDFDPGPRLVGSSDEPMWLIPMSARRKLLGIVAVSECSSVKGLERALVRVVSDLAVAEQTADVSESIHKQKSEQRFRSLVGQSQDLVAIVCDDGTITYVSPAASSVLGYNESELVGSRLADLFDADNAENLRRAFSTLAPKDSNLVNTEVDYGHPNSQVRQLALTITDLRGDETVRGFVVNARDCTEQKSMEMNLRQKASFDDLTGVANRSLLREHIGRTVARIKRSGGSCAVILLDLDDFKTVNDALGYPNGDEIIKIMAFRLSQYVRDEDAVARLGGDEFAVLLDEVTDSAEVMSVASRMLEVIEQGINFGEREVSLTASIGVALADAGSSADSVLRDADVAMYRAKERGKGSVVLFDQSMHRSAMERLDLKSDLSKALHNDQLTLYYQPIVRLNGQLLGFEALMRWRHPTRGFVSPATFIPLAEESGLIVAMGEWALRTASAQLGAWMKDHDTSALTMSVNVSPRQLYSPELLVTVKNCLEVNGLSPESLIVELTESELVDDSVASEHLMLLRKLGVGIAADDFGSGFASYAALAQLPFTMVKMDRSLIQNLSDPNSNSHAQVRSIIEMAHGIGIEVTAEGIEEYQQRDALAAMGCDKAQGYLFSRPLPSEEVVRFLRDNSYLGV